MGMELSLPNLQSQQVNIHRATRYGVSTWCHFQMTIGNVVMVAVVTLVEVLVSDDFEE